MDTDRFLAWLYQTLQVSLDNRLNPSDFVKVYPCCSGRIIGFPAWSICGRVLPRDCEASRLGAARKTPPLSSHTNAAPFFPYKIRIVQINWAGAGSREAPGAVLMKRPRSLLRGPSRWVRSAGGSRPHPSERSLPAKASASLKRFMIVAALLQTTQQ